MNAAVCKSLLAGGSAPQEEGAGWTTGRAGSISALFGVVDQVMGSVFGAALHACCRTGLKWRPLTVSRFPERLEELGLAVPKAAFAPGRLALSVGAGPPHRRPGPEGRGEGGDPVDGAAEGGDLGEPLAPQVVPEGQP